MLRPSKDRFHAPLLFHFSDGERIFTDAIGLELVGIAAVRKRVIKQVRDLKGSQSEHHIQDWSDWKMLVVDAKGKSVRDGTDWTGPRRYNGFGLLLHTNYDRAK